MTFSGFPLTRWSCRNVLGRVPVRKCHNSVVYQQQKFVSRGSGVWKSEGRVRAGPGPGEASPPGLQIFSLGFHMAERGDRLLVSLLLRAPIHARGPHPHNLVTTPRRPHPLMPSHWGLGFPYINWRGEHTNIQSTAGNVYFNSPYV